MLQGSWSATQCVNVRLTPRPRRLLAGSPASYLVSKRSVVHVSGNTDKLVESVYQVANDVERDEDVQTNRASTRYLHDFRPRQYEFLGEKKALPCGTNGILAGKPSSAAQFNTVRPKSMVTLIISL